MTLEVFDASGELLGWLPAPPRDHLLAGAREHKFVAHRPACLYPWAGSYGFTNDMLIAFHVSLRIELWANAGAQPRVVYVADDQALELLHAVRPFVMR